MDQQRKTHFKMYKAHKQWLVAGVTAFSLVVGGAFGTSHAVWADEGTPVVSAENSAGQQATDQESGDLTPAAQTPAKANGDAGQTPTTGEAAPTTDGTQPTAASAQTGEQTAQVSDTDGTSSNDADSSVTAQDVASSKGTDLDGANSNNVNDEAESAETPATDQSQQARPEARSARALSESEDGSDPAETPADEDAEEAPSDGETDPANDQQTSPLLGLSNNEVDGADLANVIAATNTFNVSKTNALQYTYSHLDRDASLKNMSGAKMWQSQAFADAIPMDAAGYYQNTTVYNIDLWMPDYALQYVLWQSAFSSQYATINDFRANFTKNDLAALTNFTTDQAAQNTYGNSQTQGAPTTYYQALMSMQSLEGLQYATNLKTINLSPNIIVSENVYGTPTKNGNLWDIKALTNLTQLQSVQMVMFSITDVTALGDKPSLTNLSLSYNMITDISPLASDSGLNGSAALGFQHVLLDSITIREGTASYTTPSFIVKDLTDTNVPVQGYDGSGQSGYPGLYPSSSNGGNIDPQTLTWYGMLPDTSTNYGAFSTTWNDAATGFEGWFIQPYALDANASNIVVNYQLLKADGTQLTLAPSTVLSAEVDDTANLLSTTTVVNRITNLVNEQGFTFAGRLIDGTGLFADAMANNGLAHFLATDAVTFTEDPQNFTILFLQDWDLTVHCYAKTIDENGAEVLTEMPAAIAPSKTTSTNLNTPVLITDIVPDLSADKYAFDRVDTSPEGINWTTLSADATTLPFQDNDQEVRVIYHAVQQAKVQFVDADTLDANGDPTVLETLDYTTDPALQGELGAAITYDPAAKIAAYEAAGYRLVSDGTTSGYDFPLDPLADTPIFTITLAHTQSLKDTTTVAQTIHYTDGTDPLAPDATQQVTFTTVVDNTIPNDPGTVYFKLGENTPALDATTQLFDSTGWTVYGDDAKPSFTVTANPAVPGWRVDLINPAQTGLTQVDETAVTPTTADSEITVTYVRAYEISDMSTVTQTITYQNKYGDIIHEPATATKTVLTVSDGQGGTTTFVADGAVTDQPTLDENGVPTTGNWTQVPAGETPLFAPVINPTIAGMHVVSTTDPAGDLTRITAQPVTGDASQDFTVTYDYTEGVVPPEEAATLTVQFVDENGKTLLPSERKAFTIGSGYEYTAPAIGGYHLATAELLADASLTNGVASGHITTSNDILTFVYKMNDGVVPPEEAATLTVQFVDENGKTLLPSERKALTIGSGYEYTAPKIGGYHLETAELPAGGSLTEGVASGQITTSNDILTFVYKMNDGVVPPEEAATLTVEFVDENGKTLRPSERKALTIGSGYEYAAPEISGYHLETAHLPAGGSLSDGVASGQITTSNDVLTFVYKMNDGVVPPEEAATLTVQFVDENGKTLLPSERKALTVGSGYEYTAPEISRYHLESAELPADGTFTDGVAKGQITTSHAVLTFVYKMNEGVTPTPQPATLAIHFVDGAGHTIQQDTVLTRAVGNGYTFVAPALTGYTFDHAILPDGTESRNRTTIGTLTADAQELTLVYLPNQAPVEPSKPITPVKPETKPTTPTKPEAKPLAKPIATKPAATKPAEKSLPQTGDSQDGLLAAMGALMLASLALVGIRPTRKEK
ncbi:MucBP domain-containing protein [Lacticaseibacillus yichunensis]|uniref:MucBP domain-containing protein n=1 Tax=Lacticaseibacillus yichunensis TaxID=2486015 RepID=A0ABW4CQH8_9LACO|nr:MucBP domain-containing protein [Lacticaseibacillus yichunensis]